MNLLTDPLLRAVTDRGEESLSLPALLEALGQDRVQHFTGLQRHQADAFHVFLCYLAGAILARDGHRDPVRSEAYWREGMRLLAGEAGDSAWTLVVDDLSKPAFMQPPLPKGEHGNLKRAADSADALDLLPTAKNHDMKQTRAIHSTPDEWVYALISLQTMSGFFGSGHYGIARMNGGHGNRSVVELVRSYSPGCRWRDAVTRLLDHRDGVLAGEFGYDPRGLVLVWLEPWDGQTSLPLSRLDPFHIEICRRMRLRSDGKRIWAESLLSQANRIAAKELKGIVGDAWLPVDLGADGGKRADAKALTISPQGLTADVLRRLVFADGIQLTPLQRPGPGWSGPLWLTVSVLIRGQGTTDGFHSRDIPIPPPVRARLFGSPDKRRPLAQLAKTALEYAGLLENRVLKPAVFAYIEGAPESIQFDRASAKAWWQRFSSRFTDLWSRDYFPWLWSVPDPFEEETVLNAWTRLLADRALAVLDEAAAAMPQRTGRQYRTRVQAERTFWAALYRELPHLKEEKHERIAST